MGYNITHNHQTTEILLAMLPAKNGQERLPSSHYVGTRHSRLKPIKAPRTPLTRKSGEWMAWSNQIGDGVD
jgi:hypothetical protein